MSKKLTLHHLELIWAKIKTLIPDVSNFITKSEVDEKILPVTNRISVIEGKESGWDAKYNKPSSGIPKTDFASAVQTSLTKADNALPNTTTHLSGDIANTEKGAANGVASLGSDGKVPSSQLPSYVDDVLEYNSKSAFPATGESGKIYIDKSDNKTYRWSGSAYVEISQSLALGETASTAYAGNKGKANTDAIAVIQSNLSNYYVKSEIDNLLNGKQNSISDLATIRSNASNGATAYGWGNHASAGYLKNITSLMVTTALGYTPVNKAGDTLSGTLLRTDNASPVIKVYGDIDFTILDIKDTATSQGYGFDLKYLGSQNGNNNSLELIADNQTGTKVKAFTLTQDGIFNFEKIPNVNGTNIALTSNIPTNNNQLINGAGYIKGITKSMVDAVISYQAPITSTNKLAASLVSGLSTVAISGSYDDLSNKPSIPAAVTETIVSGWGFTKNVGTITGIKMNGSSKGTSGIIDLGTVLTSHQSLSGYATENWVNNKGFLTSHQSLALNVSALSNNPSSIALDSTANRTYQTCTLSSRTSVTLSGGNSNAGYEHYILFYNSYSKDCIITKASGMLGPEEITVPAGKRLELSWVYNGNNVILTASEPLQ